MPEQLSAAEMIKNINDNVPDPAQSAPQQTASPTTPAPAAQQPATEPATPAAQPTKQPKTQPASAAPSTPPATEGVKDKPIDPPFLAKYGDQPTGDDEPGTPAAAGAPATPAAQPVPDEAIYSRLSALTSGAVTSEKALVKLINDYNGLVEQAEKGFEPKFANERAKWVHGLLNANQGAEPEAAMRLLRALQFKAEGKSDREVLFQQYLQDPKNSDLSELDAQKYFEADFATKYELLDKLEDDLTPEQKRQKLVLQRELATSVRDAKASIKTTQDEWAATEAKPQQVAKEVTDSITKAVGDFQGLKYSFSKDAKETDFLNLPPPNPQQAQELLNDILNPDVAYNEMIAEYTTDKGMDWAALVRESYERKHHKEIGQQKFEHGFKLGQLAKINKDKNASTPKDVSQIATPAGERPLGFQDTWLGAAESKRAS